jgi:hypothetical protein
VTPVTNACDTCGNALNECECDKSAPVERVPLGLGARPGKSRVGRWYEHKAGCTSCRIGTMCERGRKLYYPAMRAEGKK